ncbi:MAG: ATP-binding cassette domain-containing protein [Pseudomonadota bacterium]
MNVFASGAPTLVLDDVSKSLGNVQVLSHLSVDIDGRGGTALVGESGSGKSTLLALALGLLRPDTGSVTLFGERLDDNNVRAVRQRIGYAVQEAGLFPHLSVRDNLTLQGRLQGLDRAALNVRADELAERMRLDSAMLGRYPVELSGGQQQRAGICRAMMLEPTLLLLDEPFSGLDVVTRIDIYKHFIELASSREAGFVLVTHDLSEAHRLCEHVAILRHGEIIAHGRTAEIIANPPHAYARELVEAQRLHVSHG